MLTASIRPVSPISRLMAKVKIDMRSHPPSAGQNPVTSNPRTTCAAIHSTLDVLETLMAQHDIGGADAGGQNIYVNHVARTLAARGHRVDVAGVEVTADETYEAPVLDDVRIMVDGFVEVVVSPGTPPADLDRRVVRARSAFEAALHEAGADSLDEARASHERRRVAESQCATAEDALSDALGGTTLDDLELRLATLERRRADEPASEAADGDRDALDAGARIGPRFYATGEPIDGSRVYYNFMRPTETDRDVARELTRAKALDYDFLKTYVRLPADRMKTVVDFAHRLGLRSESHYLSPGAFVGQDGTSHLAATQRLGFARTITATGQSYADVPTMYGQGRRNVTTTLFTTDFLSRDEVTSDPRLPLWPSWRRASLLEGVADNDADPSDPQCATAPCREVRTMKRIADAGGLVLVGTDAPIDNPGIGVHANIQEMVGYGWTPYDALRAAIINPARYLGVAKDVGTLERGKVADLIGVRGDPLTDVDAAARVELTMVGGKAYTRDELIGPFAGSVGGRSVPSGPAPATKVTERADRAVTRKYWWHDPKVVAESYAHACDAYESLHQH